MIRWNKTSKGRYRAVTVRWAAQIDKASSGNWWLGWVCVFGSSTGENDETVHFEVRSLAKGKRIAECALEVMGMEP